MRHVSKLTCYNVSGTSWKLPQEDVENDKQLKSVVQLEPRTCYNVSGTSWNLPQEDAETYETRLATYIKNMLQCIRHVLKVTSRRC